MLPWRLSDILFFCFVFYQPPTLFLHTCLFYTNVMFIYFFWLNSHMLHLFSALFVTVFFVTQLYITLLFRPLNRDPILHLCYSLCTGQGHITTGNHWPNFINPVSFADIVFWICFILFTLPNDSVPGRWPRPTYFLCILSIVNVI